MPHPLLQLLSTVERGDHMETNQRDTHLRIPLGHVQWSRETGKKQQKSIGEWNQQIKDILIKKKRSTNNSAIPMLMSTKNTLVVPGYNTSHEYRNLQGRN